MGKSLRSNRCALTLTWFAVLAIGASPVSVDALDKTSLYGKDPNLTKVSAHLLQARELLREGASSLDVQQQVPVLTMPVG